MLFSVVPSTAAQQMMPTSTIRPRPIDFIPDICSVQPGQCPYWIEAQASNEAKTHGSATFYTKLSLINNTAGMIVFLMIVWSYYTVLWRYEKTIALASCGCSEACPSICNVEKCAPQCEKFASDIDSCVLVVDWITLPIVILATVVGIIFMAWANPTHYNYVEK